MCLSFLFPPQVAALRPVQPNSSSTNQQLEQQLQTSAGLEQVEVYYGAKLDGLRFEPQGPADKTAGTVGWLRKPVWDAVESAGGAVLRHVPSWNKTGRLVVKVKRQEYKLGAFAGALPLLLIEVDAKGSVLVIIDQGTGVKLYDVADAKVALYLGADLVSGNLPEGVLPNERYPDSLGYISASVWGRVEAAKGAVITGYPAAKRGSYYYFKARGKYYPTRVPVGDPEQIRLRIAFDSKGKPTVAYNEATNALVFSVNDPKIEAYLGATLDGPRFSPENPAWKAFRRASDMRFSWEDIKRAGGAVLRHYPARVRGTKWIFVVNQKDYITPIRKDEADKVFLLIEVDAQGDVVQAYNEATGELMYSPASKSIRAYLGQSLSEFPYVPPGEADESFIASNSLREKFWRQVEQAGGAVITGYPTVFEQGRMEFNIAKRAYRTNVPESEDGARIFLTLALDGQGEVLLAYNEATGDEVHASQPLARARGAFIDMATSDGDWLAVGEFARSPETTITPAPAQPSFSVLSSWWEGMTFKHRVLQSDDQLDYLDALGRRPRHFRYQRDDIDVGLEERRVTGELIRGRGVSHPSVSGVRRALVSRLEAEASDGNIVDWHGARYTKHGRRWFLETPLESMQPGLIALGAVLPIGDGWHLVTGDAFEYGHLSLSQVVAGRSASLLNNHLDVLWAQQQADENPSAEVELGGVVYRRVLHGARSKPIWAYPPKTSLVLLRSSLIAVGAVMPMDSTWHAVTGPGFREAPLLLSQDISRIAAQHLNERLDALWMEQQSANNPSAEVEYAGVVYRRAQLLSGQSKPAWTYPPGTSAESLKRGLIALGVILPLEPALPSDPLMSVAPGESMVIGRVLEDVLTLTTVTASRTSALLNGHLDTLWQEQLASGNPSAELEYAGVIYRRAIVGPSGHNVWSYSEASEPLLRRGLILLGALLPVEAEEVVVTGKGFEAPPLSLSEVIGQRAAKVLNVHLDALWETQKASGNPSAEVTFEGVVYRRAFSRAQFLWAYPADTPVETLHRSLIAVGAILRMPQNAGAVTKNGLRETLSSTVAEAEEAAKLLNTHLDASWQVQKDSDNPSAEVSYLGVVYRRAYSLAKRRPKAIWIYPQDVSVAALIQGLNALGTNFPMPSSDVGLSGILGLAGSNASWLDGNNIGLEEQRVGVDLIKSLGIKRNATAGDVRRALLSALEAAASSGDSVVFGGVRYEKRKNSWYVNASAEALRPGLIAVGAILPITAEEYVVTSRAFEVAPLSFSESVARDAAHHLNAHLDALWARQQEATPSAELEFAGIVFRRALGHGDSRKPVWTYSSRTSVSSLHQALITSGALLPMPVGYHATTIQGVQSALGISDAIAQSVAKLLNAHLDILWVRQQEASPSAEIEFAGIVFRRALSRAKIPQPVWVFSSGASVETLRQGLIALGAILPMDAGAVVVTASGFRQVPLSLSQTVALQSANLLRGYLDASWQAQKDAKNPSAEVVSEGVRYRYALVDAETPYPAWTFAPDVAIDLLKKKLIALGAILRMDPGSGVVSISGLQDAPLNLSGTLAQRAASLLNDHLNVLWERQQDQGNSSVEVELGGIVFRRALGGGENPQQLWTYPPGTSARDLHEILTSLGAVLPMLGESYFVLGSVLQETLPFWSKVAAGRASALLNEHLDALWAAQQEAGQPSVDVEFSGVVFRRAMSPGNKPAWSYPSGTAVGEIHRGLIALGAILPMDSGAHIFTENGLKASYALPPRLARTASNALSQYLDEIQASQRDNGNPSAEVVYAGVVYRRATTHAKIPQQRWTVAPDVELESLREGLLRLGVDLPAASPLPALSRLAASRSAWLGSTGLEEVVLYAGATLSGPEFLAPDNITPQRVSSLKHLRATAWQGLRDAGGGVATHYPTHKGVRGHFAFRVDGQEYQTTVPFEASREVRLVLHMNAEGDVTVAYDMVTQELLYSMPEHRIVVYFGQALQPDGSFEPSEDGASEQLLQSSSRTSHWDAVRQAGGAVVTGYQTYRYGAYHAFRLDGEVYATTVRHDERPTMYLRIALDDASLPLVAYDTETGDEVYRASQEENLRIELFLGQKLQNGQFDAPLKMLPQSFKTVASMRESLLPDIKSNGGAVIRHFPLFKAGHKIGFHFLKTRHFLDAGHDEDGSGTIRMELNANGGVVAAYSETTGQQVYTPDNHIELYVGLRLKGNTFTPPEDVEPKRYQGPRGLRFETAKTQGGAVVRHLPARHQKGYFVFSIATVRYRTSRPFVDGETLTLLVDVGSDAKPTVAFDEATGEQVYPVRENALRAISEIAASEATWLGTGDIGLEEVPITRPLLLQAGISNTAVSGIRKALLARLDAVSGGENSVEWHGVVYRRDGSRWLVDASVEDMKPGLIAVGGILSMEDGWRHVSKPVFVDAPYDYTSHLSAQVVKVLIQHLDALWKQQQGSGNMSAEVTYLGVTYRRVLGPKRRGHAWSFPADTPEETIRRTAMSLGVAFQMEDGWRLMNKLSLKMEPLSLTDVVSASAYQLLNAHLNTLWEQQKADGNHSVDVEFDGVTYRYALGHKTKGWSYPESTPAETLRRSLIALGVVMHMEDGWRVVRHYGFEIAPFSLSAENAKAANRLLNHHLDALWAAQQAEGNPSAEVTYAGVLYRRALNQAKRPEASWIYGPDVSSETLSQGLVALGAVLPMPENWNVVTGAAFGGAPLSLPDNYARRAASSMNTHLGVLWAAQQAAKNASGEVVVEGVVYRRVLGGGRYPKPMWAYSSEVEAASLRQSMTAMGAILPMENGWHSVTTDGFGEAPLSISGSIAKNASNLLERHLDTLWAAQQTAGNPSARVEYEGVAYHRSFITKVFSVQVWAYSGDVEAQALYRGLVSLGAILRVREGWREVSRAAFGNDGFLRLSPKIAYDASSALNKHLDGLLQSQNDAANLSVEVEAGGIVFQRVVGAGSSTNRVWAYPPEVEPRQLRQLLMSLGVELPPVPADTLGDIIVLAETQADWLDLSDAGLEEQYPVTGKWVQSLGVSSKQVASVKAAWVAEIEAHSAGQRQFVHQNVRYTKHARDWSAEASLETIRPILIASGAAFPMEEDYRAVTVRDLKTDYASIGGTRASSLAKLLNAHLDGLWHLQKASGNASAEVEYGGIRFRRALSRGDLPRPVWSYPEATSFKRFSGALAALGGIMPMEEGSKQVTREGFMGAPLSFHAFLAKRSSNLLNTYLDALWADQQRLGNPSAEVLLEGVVYRRSVARDLLGANPFWSYSSEVSVDQVKRGMISSGAVLPIEEGWRDVTRRTFRQAPMVLNDSTAPKSAQLLNARLNLLWKYQQDHGYPSADVEYAGIVFRRVLSVAGEKAEPVWAYPPEISRDQLDQVLASLGVVLPIREGWHGVTTRALGEVLDALSFAASMDAARLLRGHLDRLWHQQKDNGNPSAEVVFGGITFRRGPHAIWTYSSEVTLEQLYIVLANLGVHRPGYAPSALGGISQLATSNGAWLSSTALEGGAEITGGLEEIEMYPGAELDGNRFVPTVEPVHAFSRPGSYKDSHWQKIRDAGGGVVRHYLTRKSNSLRVFTVNSVEYPVGFDADLEDSLRLLIQLDGNARVVAAYNEATGDEIYPSFLEQLPTRVYLGQHKLSEFGIPNADPDHYAVASSGFGPALWQSIRDAGGAVITNFNVIGPNRHQQSLRVAGENYLVKGTAGRPPSHVLLEVDAELVPVAAYAMDDGRPIEIKTNYIHMFLGAELKGMPFERPSESPPTLLGDPSALRHVWSDVETSGRAVLLNYPASRASAGGLQFNLARQSYQTDFDYEEGVTLSVQVDAARRPVVAYREDTSQLVFDARDQIRLHLGDSLDVSSVAWPIVDAHRLFKAPKGIAKATWQKVQGAGGGVFVHYPGQYKGPGQHYFKMRSVMYRVHSIPGSTGVRHYRVLVGADGKPIEAYDEVAAQKVYPMVTRLQMYLGETLTGPEFVPQSNPIPVTSARGINWAVVEEAGGAVLRYYPVGVREGRYRLKVGRKKYTLDTPYDEDRNLELMLALDDQLNLLVAFDEATGGVIYTQEEVPLPALAALATSDGDWLTDLPVESGSQTSAVKAVAPERFVGHSVHDQYWESSVLTQHFYGLGLGRRKPLNAVGSEPIKYPLKNPLMPLEWRAVTTGLEEHFEDWSRNAQSADVVVISDQMLSGAMGGQIKEALAHMPRALARRTVLVGSEWGGLEERNPVLHVVKEPGLEAIAVAVLQQVPEPQSAWVVGQDAAGLEAMLGEFGIVVRPVNTPQTFTQFVLQIGKALGVPTTVLEQTRQFLDSFAVLDLAA